MMERDVVRQALFSGSKWETLYLDFERTSLVRVKRRNNRLADCFFWITLKYNNHNEKTAIKLPINFLHQTLDLLDTRFVGIKRISERVVIVSEEDVTVDDAASLPIQKFRAMSQTIIAWLDKQFDLCRSSLRVYAAYRRGILSSYVYNVSLGVNWSIKHYVLQIVVPLMLQEVCSLSCEDNVSNKLHKFLSILTSSHLRKRRRALGIFDYFVSSMWIMMAINDTQGELYKALFETLTHFLQNNPQLSEPTQFTPNFSNVKSRATPASQLHKTNRALSNYSSIRERSTWTYFDWKTEHKFNDSSTLGWAIIRGDMFVLWVNGLWHLPYPRYFLKEFYDNSFSATMEGLAVEINAVFCKWGFIVIRLDGLVMCQTSVFTLDTVLKNIPRPPERNNCGRRCYCAHCRSMLPFMGAHFSLETLCISTIKSLLFTPSRTLQELLCIQQELTFNLPKHFLSRIFSRDECCSSFAL
jgi:hypothetical protein